jgi:hypothetical protein
MRIALNRDDSARCRGQETNIDETRLAFSPFRGGNRLVGVVAARQS